jgi:hypothetical protein
LKRGTAEVRIELPKYQQITMNSQILQLHQQQVTQLNIHFLKADVVWKFALEEKVSCSCIIYDKLQYDAGALDNSISGTTALTTLLRCRTI